MPAREQSIRDRLENKTVKQLQVQSTYNMRSHGRLKFQDPEGRRSASRYHPVADCTAIETLMVWRRRGIWGP